MTYNIHDDFLQWGRNHPAIIKIQNTNEMWESWQN